MRLAFKILTAAVLTVVLLLPLGLIRGTVQERQQYRMDAVESVARSTAGAQTIAGPVLFLASPAARFVTGVVLPVDGGYLIT